MIWVGLAHGLLALICLGLLHMPARPILGLHPAHKPLKFALSIAAFLVTMAVLLPLLTVSDATRAALTWALSLTMSAEMVVIAMQALRGRRSHFNVEQPLDVAVIVTMFVGIGVLLIAMGVIVVVATARPLAATLLMATAWRAALWLFLFSAVSGFGMGGRAGHSIGGHDSDPGMAITGWSKTHGDLRVTHFLSLHALQFIPLTAAAIERFPMGAMAQFALLALVIGASVGLTVWTWRLALAGKPLLSWPAGLEGRNR